LLAVDSCIGFNFFFNFFFGFKILGVGVEDKDGNASSYFGSSTGIVLAAFSFVARICFVSTISFSRKTLHPSRIAFKMQYAAPTRWTHLLIRHGISRASRRRTPTRPSTWKTPNTG
jgi:hypothetical protein